MYVTYTRIYGWSDYGGESSYQPGYRLENMMWMTLLVYDYIIPGEKNMSEEREEITEETAPLPLKMQEAPAPIQESENKAQTDTFNFTEAVLMALNEE